MPFVGWGALPAAADAQDWFDAQVGFTTFDNRNVACTVRVASQIVDDVGDGQTFMSASSQVLAGDPECEEAVEVLEIVAAYTQDPDAMVERFDAIAGPGSMRVEGHASVNGPVIALRPLHSFVFRCLNPPNNNFCSFQFATQPK